jgi:hypothetical protein
MKTPFYLTFIFAENVKKEKSCPDFGGTAPVFRNIV